MLSIPYSLSLITRRLESCLAPPIQVTSAVAELQYQLIVVVVPGIQASLGYMTHR